MQSFEKRLYTHRLSPDRICQVVGKWDKRDIDPDCPLSVAIVTMYRVVYLTGEDIGKERSVRATQFNRLWKSA